MLSSEIEINPGPQLEKLIEYSSYLKNRGSSHSPMFFLINCQSLKNRFEEFTNFLQTAPIKTFVAVTKTWLDTDCNIENNFLTAWQFFFRKCRSDKTWVSKGGGVGIFIPKEFTASFKSSIETNDESFLIHLGWNNWPSDKKFLLTILIAQTNVLGSIVLIC